MMDFKENRVSKKGPMGLIGDLFWRIFMSRINLKGNIFDFIGTIIRVDDAEPLDTRILPTLI